MHSLTMSLKSRLGSEVAYALNALTLISLTVRQSANDQQGLAFPLAACGDLFDELLDLLEETAFGVADEDDRPSGLIPTEPDRGTVFAKQPPKSGRHKAPAVLAADARQVFGYLVSGMHPVFANLSSLLDASSAKQE